MKKIIFILFAFLHSLIMAGGSHEDLESLTTQERESSFSCVQEAPYAISLTSLINQRNDHFKIFVPMELASLYHPERLFVLMCDDHEVIPDNFWDYYLASKAVPSIHNLSIRGDHLKKIGINFLSGLTDLTRVDLSHLTNLEEVGHDFMYGNPKLESVDLSASHRVHSLGAFFLFECTALQRVIFSKRQKIQHIPSHFMSRCYALTHIELGETRWIKKIDSGFLSGAHALEHLDLGNLDTLDVIEDAFLSNCLALKKLVLIAPQLVKVGKRFMYGCSSLEEVTLLCPHLSQIGEDFFTGTTCLRIVTINQNHPFLKDLFLKKDRYIREMSVQNEMITLFFEDTIGS